MHLNLRPAVGVVSHTEPLCFQVLSVEVCETPVPTVDTTLLHLLRADATYAASDDVGKATHVQRLQQATEVCVFGVNALGHSVVARVTGFKPHFFVEVTSTFTPEVLTQCASELRSRLHLRAHDLTLEFQDRKRMYGWVPAAHDATVVRSFTFGRFAFINSYVLRLAAQYLTNRTLACLHGVTVAADISENTVALSEKFLAAHQIKASGWVTVDATNFTTIAATHRATFSDVEVRCGVGALRPVSDERIAPIVIAAVDIEAHSHDYRSFPDANHPGDAITFIGTTFWVYGDTEPRVRVMQVLGSCEVPADSNIQVRSYASEYELLVGWRDLVVLDSNPDFVVSYNGTGFDYAYMARRLTYLGVRCSRFLHLGRLLMIPGQLRTRELTSAAKGQNQISLFPMSGRVQLDLFIYVRDSQKLSSYKLDDVCEHLMPNARKVVLDFRGWVRSLLATASTTLATVAADYGVPWDRCAATLDTARLTCPETDGGNPSAYREVYAAVSEVVRVVTRDISVEHQTDVRARLDTGVQPLLDAAGDNNYRKLFRLYDESAAARGAIAVYCQVDCDLVVMLLERLNVVANIVQMSQVCNTLVDDVCNRGQQIKTYNLISRFANARGYVMNVRDPGCTATTYEGATVLEPKLGYYEVPVATLDFASLYPSLMRAYNLCHSSLVMDAAYAAIPGIRYGRYEINGQTWTFQQTTPGILPEILKSLLDARKAMKTKMKTFSKESFEYRVCNGAQLALKISCNSVYGFTGVTSNGMYPCLPVAMATTYTGREALMTTRAFIEQQYGATVVYGDTDSVMVMFPAATTVTTAFDMAGRAAREISAIFPDTIVLEFEKVFFPYLLIKKKTYAGMKYEDDPSCKPTLDVKGLAVVRRDTCELVRDVMRNVLHEIMQERNPAGAHAVIAAAVTALQHGTVPLEKLQITNSLRLLESYTNTCQPQLTVVRKMTERRAFDIPRSGDRVPYIILKDDSLPRISDRAEHPAYVAEHNLPIDTEYYLVNQLQSRLESITELLPIPHIGRIFGDAVACVRDRGIDRSMLDSICAQQVRAPSQVVGLKPRTTKKRARGATTQCEVRSLFDMLPTTTKP